MVALCPSPVGYLQRRENMSDFAVVEEKVRGLIAGLARIDAGFSADADVFRELGVESGAALDLLLQIEEEFGIAIDDEDFAGARSLSRMTALILEIQSRGRAA